MKYDFECQDCTHVWEVNLPVKTFQEVKETGIPCEKCEGKSFNKFSPTNMEVCFVGFDWADKNYKEKEYRKNRSSYMGKIQKERNFVPTLVPNYKGEETKTWKEAREEARNEGKFAETYDHLVQKENTGKL